MTNSMMARRLMVPSRLQGAHGGDGAPKARSLIARRAGERRSAGPGARAARCAERRTLFVSVTYGEEMHTRSSVEACEGGRRCTTRCRMPCARLHLARLTAVGVAWVRAVQGPGSQTRRNRLL